MSMFQQDRERRLAALEAIQKLIPPHPITEVPELNRVLAAADTVGHLISPVSMVDYIPQMHAVSCRYVFLSVDQDCYHPKFCKDNERAPNQIGVLKLWKAAGGSDAMTKRVDDRTDALLARYEVSVKLQGIDGKDAYTTKCREVDFRPNSPQLENMGDSQLRQARQNVGTLAETKAKLRAIRSAMGLKQRYTLDELSRPFIIPVLVPLLDTSDPAIRRLVAAKALGVVGELYGSMAAKMLPSAQEENPPAGVDMQTGEVIDGQLVDDQEADEYEAPPPAAAPELPACSCPCGCHAEIRPEAVTKTIELVGAPRCPKCFPGRSFRYDAHRHLGSLDLPLRPDLTPVLAKQLAEADAKKNGGTR